MQRMSSNDLLRGEGLIVVDGVTVSLLNAEGIDAPDDAAWEAVADAAERAARDGGIFYYASDKLIRTPDGRAWHVSIPVGSMPRTRVAVSRDLAAAIRATGQQTPVTPESGDGLLGGSLPPAIWDPTRHADHD